MPTRNHRTGSCAVKAADDHPSGDTKGQPDPLLVGVLTDSGWPLSGSEAGPGSGDMTLLTSTAHLIATKFTPRRVAQVGWTL